MAAVVQKELDAIDQLPPLTLTPKLSVPGLAALFQKGYSEVKAARYFHVSRQAVNDYVKRHRADLEIFMDFDGVMSAKLKIKADEVLTSLDVAAIKRMPPGQKPLAVAVFIDKSRLLDNKTTENVGIRSVVSHLEGNMRAAQAELKELLGDK